MKKIFYTTILLVMSVLQISCNKEDFVSEPKKQRETPSQIAKFNSALRVVFNGQLSYAGKGNFSFGETISFLVAEIEINEYTPEQTEKREDHLISFANFHIKNVSYVFEEDALIVKAKKSKNLEYEIRGGKKMKSPTIEIPYTLGFDKSQKPDRKLIKQLYYKKNEAGFDYVKRMFSHIQKNGSLIGASF